MAGWKTCHYVVARFPGCQFSGLSSPEFTLGTGSKSGEKAIFALGRPLKRSKSFELPRKSCPRRRSRAQHSCYFDDAP